MTLSNFRNPHPLLQILNVPVNTKSWTLYINNTANMNLPINWRTHSNFNLTNIVQHKFLFEFTLREWEQIYHTNTTARCQLLPGISCLIRSSRYTLASSRVPDSAVLINQDRVRAVWRIYIFLRVKILQLLDRYTGVITRQINSDVSTNTARKTSYVHISLWQGGGCDTPRDMWNEVTFSRGENPLDTWSPVTLTYSHHTLKPHARDKFRKIYRSISTISYS